MIARRKAGAKALAADEQAYIDEMEREAAARAQQDLERAVSSLKEAAQKLLRRGGVLSETEFYERLNEAFDVLDAEDPDSARGYANLTEAQRAALAYQFVVFDLERYRVDGSPVASLARAGDWLTWWAIDGSEAALHRLQERRKQPRDAARGPRPNARTIDHAEVLGEFQRLVARGRTEAEARSTLVSRGFGSKAQVWRITTGNTQKKSLR